MCLLHRQQLHADLWSRWFMGLAAHPSSPLPCSLVVVVCAFLSARFVAPPPSLPDIPHLLCLTVSLTIRRVLPSFHCAPLLALAPFPRYLWMPASFFTVFTKVCELKCPMVLASSTAFSSVLAYSNLFWNGHMQLLGLSRPPEGTIERRTFSFVASCFPFWKACNA